MFNFWTFFFGAIIIALSGLRHYINHKQLPIQYSGKGCDVHRDDGPKVVARQKLNGIIMLGIVIGILGNIPNIIVLLKDYIIPIFK